MLIGIQVAMFGTGDVGFPTQNLWRILLLSVSDSKESVYADRLQQATKQQISNLRGVKILLMIVYKVCTGILCPATAGVFKLVFTFCT
jgi:hypothetical protein